MPCPAGKFGKSSQAYPAATAHFRAQDPPYMEMFLPKSALMLTVSSSIGHSGQRLRLTTCAYASHKQADLASLTWLEKNNKQQGEEREKEREVEGDLGSNLKLLASPSSQSVEGTTSVH